ncbi:unnamed protein product [Brassica rapa subsp. trilocularis]
MRSERNGSSGKQSCSGGRARSCGGWMQRKMCGGARSCSNKLRSCGSGGERCVDSGGARICGSCSETRNFTMVLLYKKVDLKRKDN